ncbi:MAG: endonuclease/exonuclease/phosphatase family protein [Paracoccaceae bacterium]
MGVSASEPVHAWYRDEPDRRHDRRKAHARVAQCAGWYAACLIALTASVCAAWADTYRIATFNTELSRSGPGFLVRDLAKGDAADISEAVERLVSADPDIVVLQGIDYDQKGVALALLRDRLSVAGLELPHSFAARPNTGMPTPFDLDRNGALGEARDKQGYGFFSGQGGMAILSRYPILSEKARLFSDLLWRDLPGARLPRTASGDFYEKDAQSVLRLHRSAAWDVPIALPDGTLHLLTSHAGPPLFDGPEDRNGLRNADEVRFWSLFLGGWSPDGVVATHDAFVLAGDFNNDPNGGQGIKADLRDLLAQPKLQDPVAAPAPTVVWEGRSGTTKLRVDYVLPSIAFDVADTGMLWPDPEREEASRHALVWVDIVWQ